MAPQVALSINLSANAPPSGVAVDDSGNAYVTIGPPSNSVWVVSETSGVILTTIPVGVRPYWAVYDNRTDQVFVSNSGSGNLSVISAQSLKVVANVTLPSSTASPSFMVFDPATRDVLVSEPGSSSLSAVSDSSDSVTRTIDLGTTNVPGMLAYDSGRGEIAMVNHSATGANLTFLSDSSLNAVHQVQLPGNPYTIAYDAATNEVWVTNLTDNVSVVSDMSYSVASVVAIAQGHGSPVGIVYDGGASDFFVSFTTGYLQALRGSGGASAALLALPGYASTTLGMAYDAKEAAVLAVSESSQGYVLSVVSDGAPSYSVQFTESNLPPGTPWGVSLDGFDYRSSSPFLNLTERNGTYSFTVDKVPGWKSTTQSGQVVVNGSTVSRVITWVQVAWLVTFSETGLALGTQWTVVLNGSQNLSTTDSIGFMEPNGSYQFGVSPLAGWTVSPARGQVNVSGGSLHRQVVWTRVLYEVTFTERGLPVGTNWTVEFGGTNRSSTSGTLLIQEPNGTFSFTARGIPGWLASNRTGEVHVDGGPQAVTITWSLATYTVAIAESGLPSGTTWTLTVNGTTRSSSTSSTALKEPNGTYSFTVTPVSGYNASPPRGSILVNGAPASVTIHFAPTPPSPTNGSRPSPFLGVPESEGYAILGAIVAIAVGLGAVALWRRRRGIRPQLGERPVVDGGGSGPRTEVPNPPT